VIFCHEEYNGLQDNPRPGCPCVDGGYGREKPVSTLAAAFCFGFATAGLVAAVDFGLGFLGPAVFLVAVTLSCEMSIVGQNCVLLF